MSGAGTREASLISLATSLIDQLNVEAAQNQRSYSREVEQRLVASFKVDVTSKRDQFAMHALANLIGQGHYELNTSTGRETLAHLSYLIADAMLKKSGKAAAGVPSC